MPFKRSSINQGPTLCTSGGNYQGPMRRGGRKCGDTAAGEVGGFVLMRDEWGTMRTWLRPSYIMRNASVTKPCQQNTPIKIKLASSKSQIWEDGARRQSNPRFLLSPIRGLNLSACQLGGGVRKRDDDWPLFGCSIPFQWVPQTSHSCL